MAAQRRPRSRWWGTAQGRQPYAELGSRTNPLPHRLKTYFLSAFNIS